jgi:hypothetical protein
MAYIGNQPAPSNVNSDSITDGSITNADISPSAAIDVSKLDGVTATNTELNKLDGVTATTADLNVTSGADAAGVTASDIQKTQYLSGVSSDVQTQLDNASGASVKGSLTKTFAVNETSTIALSAASTPTPIVAVTKEVPQLGVESKGNWDVRADGSNYDIEDSAPSVTLTPSSATNDGLFTLGSGSFASTDVGKRIKGNGGEAVLKTTAGAYEIVTAFNDTSTIAAGDWEMYGLDFSSGGRLKMSGFFENLSEPGSINDEDIINRVNFPQRASGGDPVNNLHVLDDNNILFSSYKSTSINQIIKLGMDTGFDLTEARIFSDCTESNPIIRDDESFFGFNHDGTKVFFISGLDSDNIFTNNNINYTLYGDGTAKIISQFDLTEDPYDLKFMSAKPTGYFDNNPTGEFDTNCIRFSSDGSKYFIFGGTNGTIVGYTASTAGAISSSDSAISGNTLNVSGVISGSSQNSTFNKFEFYDNGLKVFISDYNGTSVYRYDMTSAYDLSTATFVGSHSFSVNLTSFAFNSDGTRILQTNNDDIRAYTLSTAWDLTTVSAYSNTQHINISTVTAQPNMHYDQLWDGAWSDDGNKLYFVDNQCYVHRWDAVKPYELKGMYKYISNASDTSTKGPKYAIRTNGLDPTDGPSTGRCRGLHVSNDGTNVYWTNYDSDKIFHAILGTAHELDSRTSSSSYTVSSSYLDPYYLTIVDNGTKLYYFSQAYGGLVKHTFGTAYDLSTLAGPSAVLDHNLLPANGYGAYGIAFNSTGTSYYMQSSDTPYEESQINGGSYFHHYPIVKYSFTDGPFGSSATLDPVNVLTTSGAGDKYNGYTTNQNPFGFNDSGTSLFCFGGSSGIQIIEYRLESAFSLSVTDDKRVNSDNLQYVSTGLGITRGVEISNDGTKVLLLKSNYNNTTGEQATLYFYTLSTPWDLSTISSQAESSYNIANYAAFQYYWGLRIDPTGKIITTYRKGSGQNTNNEFRVIKLNTAYSFSGGQTELSEPLQLAGATIRGDRGQVMATSSQQRFMHTFDFTPDGQQFFYGYNESSTIQNVRMRTFSLNVPWDISQGAVEARGDQDASNWNLDLANSDMWTNWAVDHRTGIAYISHTSSQRYNDSAFNNWDQPYYTIIGKGSYDIGNGRLTSAVSLSFYDQIKFTQLPTNITYTEDMCIDIKGRYLYGITRSGILWRLNVSGTYLKDVTPHDQYFTAVTNSTGQIDTSPWTDINDMVADEDGQGFKYYAFSTDGRVTFKIVHNTDGVRSVVRNNSGTWQYNSNTTYGSETWANATSNNQFSAFRDAMGVTQNRMTKNQLDGVTDANFPATGNTFDLAIVLRSDETQTAAPTSDGITIDYDAAALNKGAILGTDYDYDVPSSTSVRITSLAAQNLKVKVL